MDGRTPSHTFLHLLSTSNETNDMHVLLVLYMLFAPSLRTFI